VLFVAYHFGIRGKGHVRAELVDETGLVGETTQDGHAGRDAGASADQPEYLDR
jgi:histidine transporter